MAIMAMAIFNANMALISIPLKGTKKPKGNTSLAVE